MDPDTCLVEILQCCSLGSRDCICDLPASHGDNCPKHAEPAYRAELVQHLRDLADWIEKGGFVPTNVQLATPTGYRVP